ncbi:unnamed protein product, partial [Heterobilharzia americana]
MTSCQRMCQHTLYSFIISICITYSFCYTVGMKYHAYRHPSLSSPSESSSSSQVGVPSSSVSQIVSEKYVTPY